MSTTVKVGVEWINTYHHDPWVCPVDAANIHFSNLDAETFYETMFRYGHPLIFDWGNDDAWASDFDHPDFGGDSLNWSDDVHFCYFAGHANHRIIDGKSYMLLGFSSQHSDFAPCVSLSEQWRLGVKTLKWLVLDACYTVDDMDPAHIVAVWGAAMQGVHLVFGFINIQSVGHLTYQKRGWFADGVCRGYALANAWVDTSYPWEGVPQGQTLSRPIAIAAGVSREDAINRRENETLEWRDFSIASTNWLAWKWRG